MRKNLTKIICLAIGLTLGLTLIAKVCSINDFDGSVPERERVCLVRLDAKTGGAKDFNYWLTTPGGVAPTLQAEMPEVEAATRFTPLSFTEDKILTNSRRELKVDIIAGDANYFKIFGTPVLIGDPVKILATKGQTMVSRSVAEKMGGMDKAIGQTFSMIDDMQTKLTVAGVFEDIPENSSVRFDIITSIECMGEWALTNWLGNERNLRDSLIICCIVALTIAIIGLIGYTTDEVNRRRKEIAIRKVLGESVRNILAMMGRDICAIAIASLAVGAAAACYLTENWLQNYPEHIDIGWQQPVAVCAALFVIIILCMVAKSWRVANENPTLGIQQE